MLFSSVTFIYFFLPATLLIYFAAPRRLRNAVLLLASLFFYFFGEPVYVLLLIFSSLSDYLLSLVIEANRGRSRAKAALISSIAINLAMLGFFKYADFAIGALNSLTGLSIPLTGVPLPIGISFFTFQTMSYTIDVYRGRVHANRSLVSLATFVCLFPQLIAGPIVRYSDIESELSDRRSDADSLAEGARRFAAGLAKKVLIANQMGELVSLLAASGERTVLLAWLSAIGYALQIYFDFSGYSDMAIGLGRMFGFSFPENFDYPYLSRSITEFWRRWHMTLGSWFRDYVYIPLGGNRVGRGRWLFNIAVVWLLTGLWHGAAWNFVLWGGFFGLLLMAEKLWLLGALERTPAALRHVYVMLCVTLSFVIFGAESAGAGFAAIGLMFGAGAEGLVGTASLYYLRSYCLLLGAAAVGCSPLPKKLFSRLTAGRAGAFLLPTATAAALLICTAELVDGSFNPFLYFRF